MRRREFVVTEGDHQHQSQRPDAPCQKPDQVEGGAVGPMRVLDHPQPAGPVPQRVQQLSVDSGGVAVIDGFGQCRTRGGVQARQRIDERTQRPRRAQRITPAAQHPHSGVQLVDELGEHRGLADAGLAAQQHHFPRAAAGHAARQRIQLRKWRLAFQQGIHRGGHDAVRL